MRVSNLILALLASLSAAGGLTLACVDVAYPNKAFRCDPSGPSPNCPDGFFCCSDDPTSLSFDKKGEPSSAFALPNFADHDEDGRNWAAPLFAGEKNSASSSGMCVKLNTDPQVIEGGEAAGCPIPCNPKWSNEQIAKVCGAEKSACCQTAEIQAADCVAAGDKNCMRPVRGEDVFSNKTNWSGKAHATHQDPGGLQCAKMYKKNSDEWNTCVRRLNVADQRGFCIAPIEDPSGKKERAQCPLKKKEYIDACEALNVDIQGCS